MAPAGFLGVLKATNHQFGTVDHQFGIVDHQPGTADHQLGTADNDCGITDSLHIVDNFIFVFFVG